MMGAGGGGPGGNERDDATGNAEPGGNLAPALSPVKQIASCVPNIGPAMDYPCREPQKTQSWFAPNFIIKNGQLPVPTGPGLGLEVDPAFLAQAEVVAKIS
jgi:L-alanine-DL-glutamate epimerase-like enolase superfamily enzyme